MEPRTETTGFARLTPWQARAVLTAWVAFAGICLAMLPVPLPPCDAREESNNNGDVALYRAEVERVHAGENYYRVAGQNWSPADTPPPASSTGGRPCPCG